MSNTVNVENRGAYVIITINRPQVMNALDPATHQALSDALDAFEANPEQLVAIVTAAGTKAFCAGGDISTMVDAQTEDDYAIPSSGYGGMTNRQSSKPIIAAVNGLAYGGGFEMVLAADLAVASDSATFGLPEPRIGTAAVAGGLHRLPRLIGMKRALHMQLTCQPIDANTALEWGIINEVVAPENVLPSAIALAENILRSAPLAIKAIMQASKAGMAYPDEFAAIDAQTNGVFESINTMLTSEDIREGLRAFMEKRRPVWQNK